MILAAGRGERMRPLTDSVPKCLLTVNDKPLIVHHLEKLARTGFTLAVVNHAHLGRMIETALYDGSRFGIRVVYSPESPVLETAGGIANALPLLGSRAFAVVNADVYSDYDYSGLARACHALESADTLAHLVLVDNPPHHAAGDFGLEQGSVTLGHPRLTYSGLGACRRELFAGIPVGTYAKLAPLLLKSIEHQRLSGEHHRGLWCDVGTPERLAALNRNFGPLV